MGIMGVRESKGMRITAAITLMTTLSGCVAPGLAGLGGSSGKGNEDGKGSLGNLSMGGLASLNQKFGGALASIGSMNDKVGSIATELGLPGGKPGYDHREWTQADQDKALAVKAFFDGKAQPDGKAFDGLPNYNPMRPGEKERYSREISRVVEKYKSRTSLNPDEMMELANTVLPVLRYLANSRTYRAAKAQAGKGVMAKVNTHGQSVASLEVPPMTSIELAVSLYCNDHGLPAPWSGMTLAPRPTANYMPAELLPIYKDVHHYSATNSSHYGTQSLVWWLRHNRCENERLTTDGKKLLEAASPGAGLKLQTYCMKEKLKTEVMNHVGAFVPVSTTQLTQFKNVLGQLEDTQQKAALVLSTDFSNPADLVNLVQTAGFKIKTGKDSLLQNEALRSVMPVLKKSGLIESMVPRNMDEQATEATMSVLQQLGEEMGRQYGDDPNSVANYAELPNGLLMKTDGHKLIIHNPTPKPQTFDNTDVVLSNVDDTKFTGKQGRSPITQRYSIGSMVPTGLNPPKDEDSKFNVKNEKEVEDMLAKLGELHPNLGVEGIKPTPDDPYECPKDTDELSGPTPKEYKISGNEEILGVVADVAEMVPVLGNIVNAFSAMTGRHWLTGKKLDGVEIAIAAFSGFTPGTGTIKGILKIGSRGARYATGTASALKLEKKAEMLSKIGQEALPAVLEAGASAVKFSAGDKCALIKGITSGAAGIACTKSHDPYCTAAKLVKAGSTRLDSMHERWTSASSQQGTVIAFDADRVRELAKADNDDGTKPYFKGVYDMVKSPSSWFGN